MSANTSANKRLIVTIALGAGALGYVFGLFLPRQRAISAQRAEIRAKQEAIAQAAALPSEIETTKRSANEAQEFVTAQRNLLPKEVALPKVHAEISRAAAAAGVRLLRFDPQPPALLDTIRQAPLLLVCEGKFEQTFDFVRKLEGLKRLIWIDRLQLGKEGEDGENVRCEINLAIFADNPEISD